jgi:hypothetical protein
MRSLVAGALSERDTWGCDAGCAGLGDLKGGRG